MRAQARFYGLAVAAVVATGSCTDNVGPTLSERFVANLTGAGEVPPVTTTATGTAEFEVFSNLPGIYFKLSVSGIDSVIASHIHGPASATENAPVIVPLYSGAATGPGVTGVLAQGVINAASGITVDSLVALLRSGNAYVNVHTKANAGGEIRGQVAKQ